MFVLSDMYPVKYNRRRILTRDDMDDIAKTALRDAYPHNLECPIPLDVYGFLLDYLQLNLKQAYLGKDILGLTVLGEDCPVTYYDENLTAHIYKEDPGTTIISTKVSRGHNIGRLRYTLIHEGSHWMLHKEMGYSACRTSQVETYETHPRTDQEWMEWQADSLAASLLMPKDVFRYIAQTELRNQGNARGYLFEGVAEDKRVFNKAIGTIAETFRVSRRAAQIRMLHLGMIQTAK